MFSSYSGHMEVVKLLMDHGTGINMRSHVSVTDMICISDEHVYMNIHKTA